LVARKGGMSYVFGKLSSRAKGFSKTYDTTPFYGNQKILVAT